MSTLSLLGERSSTVLAATFRDRTAAERVALRLLSGAAAPGTVSLLSPGDPLVARKIEPDPGGIWRTAVRSHLILGSTGLLLGLGAAAVAVAADVAGAGRSPGFATLFGSVMGTFFGVLAAGLVTLRPDHALVIRRLREALRKRRWAVVVRPRTDEQIVRSWQLLKATGGTRMRSF